MQLTQCFKEFDWSRAVFKNIFSPRISGFPVFLNQQTDSLTCELCPCVSHGRVACKGKWQFRWSLAYMLQGTGLFNSSHCHHRKGRMNATCHWIANSKYCFSRSGDGSLSSAHNSVEGEDKWETREDGHTSHSLPYTLMGAACVFWPWESADRQEIQTQASWAFCRFFSTLFPCEAMARMMSHPTQGQPSLLPWKLA